MNENSNKKILAKTGAENFTGRARETEMLRRQETDGAARGIILLSAPLAGSSEILRQNYDRIFNAHEKIPFYFAFSRREKESKNCAVRFLQTFLLQTVAFRRGDADLLKISPDVCEINELASASDAHWIHQLTTACRKESELNDERSFVRQALSAPLRAAANDAPVFVMLDDLQNAPPQIIEELKKIYAHSTVPFVFAGRRRFLLNAIESGEAKLNNVEILRLEDLPFNEAAILTENLAQEFEVKITDQTRDLIVHQFAAKPAFIEMILESARRREKNLENFQTVEQIYADELFGGRVGKFYDQIFSEVRFDFETQKQIVKLLHDGFNDENGKTLIEIWRENLSLDEKEFIRLIKELHVQEIINFDSGAIYFPLENEVLRDYVTARYRLEILKERRAFVVGETLKNSLERSAQLLEKFYRRSSAVGLRELLSVFDCRNVPASLFDYAAFKKNYKDEAEISGGAATVLKLPQIVYAASGAAFYPPISQVADDERVAVALGFETADYRSENEIAWVAAEIDSKLEAAREITEFWCDRLEAIALVCDFPKYQLWLVAPEGFAPEAVEVLRQRHAFASSRRQVELLIKHLNAENIVQNKTAANEYEMILPMDDDTELIAAGAIEEIAKRHHFAPQDITKIKTALVEAYINAAEHSLSPDRKIYQKFSVEGDKITIIVSNRGIKLSPEKFAASASPIEPESGRRGWGLKLMRTLMDEVNFEQVDDGTRISMVKYLR
ncbi:MAG: ATP-binding protein [Pyrinomonadaceae bacterium]